MHLWSNFFNRILESGWHCGSSGDEEVGYFLMCFTYYPLNPTSEPVEHVQLAGHYTQYASTKNTPHSKNTPPPKPPAPTWSKTSLGGNSMSRHRPNKHFGETTGVAKHAVSSTAWSERWAPAKHERRTILVVDHPLKSLPTPRSYSLFFHDLG